MARLVVERLLRKQTQLIAGWEQQLLIKRLLELLLLVQLSASNKSQREERRVLRLEVLIEKQQLDQEIYSLRQEAISLLHARPSVHVHVATMSHAPKGRERPSLQGAVVLHQLRQLVLALKDLPAEFVPLGKIDLLDQQVLAAQDLEAPLEALAHLEVHEVLAREVLVLHVALLHPARVQAAALLEVADATNERIQ